MGLFRRFVPANQSVQSVPVLGPDPYAARYVGTLTSHIATVMDGRDGALRIGDRYSHAWHGWFQGSPPQRFTGAAGAMIYGTPRVNTAGNQKKTLQAVLQDTANLQAWLTQQAGGQS